MDSDTAELIPASRRAHRHRVAHANPDLGARAIAAMTAIFLVASIALGGSARGGPGDTALQLVALSILAVLVLMPVATARMSRTAWLLVGLTLCLPVLQWLPMPTAVPALGALRQQLASQMAVAGASPSSTLGLDRLAVERALLGLLPSLAMFVLAWRLPHRYRRGLFLLLLVLAAGCVLLGLAQRADGPDSWMRPYVPTNATDAVGLFANRNHYAALLIACLPFAIGAAAWASRAAGKARGGIQGRLLPLLASMGLVLLLIIGIVMSRSRAGMLLGLLSVVLLMPVLYTHLRQPDVRRVLLVIVLLSMVLTVQFGMLGVVQRLASDPLADGRWTYARVVQHAAADAAPLGSGLGTFIQVYPEQEWRLGLGPDYAMVNHAHNDYAELWLEGGWPLLGCLAGFALVFLRISVDVWGSHLEADSSSVLIRRLAWASCVLLLVHSAFDYPLRTTAMSVVFALMLGIAMAPSHRVASGQ